MEGEIAVAVWAEVFAVGAEGGVAKWARMGDALHERRYQDETQLRRGLAFERDLSTRRDKSATTYPCLDLLELGSWHWPATLERWHSIGVTDTARLIAAWRWRAGGAERYPSHESDVQPISRISKARRAHEKTNKNEILNKCNYIYTHA